MEGWLAAVIAGGTLIINSIVIAVIEIKRNKELNRQKQEEAERLKLIREDADLRKWLKEQLQIITAEITQLATRVDLLTEAQKSSMHERVRYLTSVYLDMEDIDIDDKTILKEMHNAAQGIGMNGDLDTRMAAIDKMPLRKHT